MVGLFKKRKKRFAKKFVKKFGGGFMSPRNGLVSGLDVPIDTTNGIEGALRSKFKTR